MGSPPEQFFDVGLTVHLPEMYVKGKYFGFFLFCINVFITMNNIYAAIIATVRPNTHLIKVIPDIQEFHI